MPVSNRASALLALFVGVIVTPCFGQYYGHPQPTGPISWSQSDQVPFVASSPGEYDYNDYPAVSYNQPGYYQNDVMLGDQSQGQYYYPQPVVRQSLRWFSSVEATILRPSLDRPNAGGQIFDSQKRIVNRVRAGEVNGFYAAPRVTLGASNGDNGIAFRYWQLEFSDTTFLDPRALRDSGIPAQIGLGYENFEMDVYTMDVELTRNVQFRNSQGQLSIGPRYVELESSAFSHVSDELGLLELGLINNYGLIHYNGVGVTGGLTGTRPIRNGWSLFWGGRASGIFGSYFEKKVVTGAIDSSYASSEVVINDSRVTTSTQTNGSGQARANGIAGPDNNLWILEGQLGLRYTQQLTWMPAEAFMNFGFEYQYWDMPDAYTDATLAVGSATLPGPAAPLSSSIDLIGFNLSVGLNY